uniref:Putative cation/H(+) antiporter 2-like isoform X1 n=1 Tax=Davidia involucrata TaxID=16924 RepID=A0A5B7C3I2_DAVIN
MATDYYETMALFARIMIMFLIGLEMDVPCLMRNLRPASIIACGSCVMCCLFAAAITPFIYQETSAHGPMISMTLMVAVTLANAASPIVIRVAAELKFATSDVGRLAISSSLICDMYCVILLVIMSRAKHKIGIFLWALEGFGSLLMVVAVIVLNMYLANWLNRRNRNAKNLKNAEAFGILSLVVVTALALETLGFNSIIGCFLIGSMFPRGGKTARTLLPKLTYSVHNFILPIYFGYTGFQADVTTITTLPNVAIVVIVILLSLGGKISGTLFACHYLKVPLSEGVLLAFLMTMKGHVDLLILTLSLQNKYIVSQDFYSVMMATLVINTLIAGPVTAYMVRRESEFIGYRSKAFALQDPEAELIMLACVHSPRPVATMLGLIAASRGSQNIPITPYLLHLIELPEKTNTNLMYHQREDDEYFSDEEDYGGDDVVEINDAVDGFFAETGVMIHQVKAVSPYVSMYVDVCDRAEDIRASIILLPFHKHRRIDGKMESGREGIRTTNQKVLRHAQCSVAILVDRGLTGASSHRAAASGSESLQHVAILFFGGADDREALGFSRRLGMHHHINLTVIRFLPAASSSKEEDQNVGADVPRKEDDVLMAISDHDIENEADSTVLTDFYNRYVTSGQVGYVEKNVENGEETASALRDMADIYSLFVVGKGGRRQSPLTTGMSDWEECPELGTVGDLLASSDFDISGSVLVIQHYRPTQNDDDR